MSPLISYFDDSHDHGMFVVAGYVAPSEAWEGFSQTWKQILEDAPHPVSEFKASDCRHRTKEFSGWSKEETTELTKELVSLITDPAMAGMVGVGDGVFVSRMDGGLRARFRKLSYYTASTNVIGRTLMLAAEVEGCSEVELVFDEQGKMEHLARQAAESVAGLYGDVYEGTLRGPRFDKSHETIPLQAADLLAYESLKEVRNRIEGRDASTALERLTQGRRHDCGYLNLGPVLHTDNVGDPLPEYDGGARLGVVYDEDGAAANRGRRLDNPEA